MLGILAALVTAFFDVMSSSSFFGYSLLVVSVISSIGLMVSVLRRLMGRY